MAGAIGGLFPQVCADAINHSCMNAEWHFRLATSQYVHDGSGVIEFAGITLALWLAIRRTRDQRTAASIGYRILGWGAVVGYPALGVSYLFDIYGGIIEALFFVGFTAMVLMELAERLRGQAVGAPRPERDGRRACGSGGLAGYSAPERGGRLGLGLGLRPPFG
jgi:hypothetical protein